MTDARNRSEWSRTSAIMAILANCHSKSKTFKPSDFDPYAEPAEPIRMKGSQFIATVAKWVGAK